MNPGFSIVNIFVVLLCPTMAEQCFNISVEPQTEGMGLIKK